LVRDQPFFGAEDEDPHDHLREFKELYSCLVIPGITQETLRWKMFPFSLTERVEQWYTHNVGNMNGNWGRLRDDFVSRPLLYPSHLLHGVTSLHLGNQRRSP
jgi:hypothetical protein